MKEEKLTGSNVAIVAIGRSQVDYHLSLAHSTEYDEVWGINCMGAITKCDRVFMLDPASRFLDTEDAGSQTGIMRKWLPEADVPIYTCELDERVPALQEYPLYEVINDAHCGYLNNTVAYAIAYAFYQRVGQINLFGIDFSYKGNVHFAEQGRACCEYWIDPIVLDIQSDKLTPMTNSDFQKREYEKNLKNITEIRTVMDTPPEAKRY